MMTEEMNNNVDNAEYVKQLPAVGLSQEEILKKTEVYCNYGENIYCNMSLMLQEIQCENSVSKVGSET